MSQYDKLLAARFMMQHEDTKAKQLAILKKVEVAEKHYLGPLMLLDLMDHPEWTSEDYIREVKASLETGKLAEMGKANARLQVACVLRGWEERAKHAS